MLKIGKRIYILTLMTLSLPVPAGDFVMFKEFYMISM